MLESCVDVMDAALSKVLVEPRLRITCSVASVSCSSPANARGEERHPSQMKQFGPCRATALPLLQIQETKLRECHAWRDNQLRAVKEVLSPSQGQESLLYPAAHFQTLAQSARGTKKPHDAYPNRADDSLRRPQTLARFPKAVPKQLIPPAYWPIKCHYPNQSDDRCALGTSRHSANMFRCR